MTTSSISQPSIFAVFRRRNFVLLWLAQFVSTMGSGLTAIAASILVFRETGSALSVGLMLLATSLPGLLVGLIAGVFVDRYDRKKLMIGAEITRAGLILLIPILLPFGVAWLYVLVMLSSVVAQFFNPAQASVIPEIAPDEELAAANSLMTISNFGALTVGFAGAGLIASLYSIEWAFYLDVVTFTLSALCIFLAQIPAHSTTEETSITAITRNLKAGINFVRTTPVLRSLFLVFIPSFLMFGLLNALVLPFATKTLGGSEFEYSLVEVTITIGFVAGSMLMARFADRLHGGQWVALSIMAMGIQGMAFALSPTIGFAIVISALQGFLNAPSYIGRSLLIQRNTPRDMRGRVSSAFFVTRDTAFMVGMATAGLADLFDIRLLLVIDAVVLIGCGLLALVLPGLGQPTAEWRRMLVMLRTAPSAAGMGLGRAATLADIDLLVGHLPVLASLGTHQRKELADQSRVYAAPAGTAIVRQNDASQAAYFLLEGRTVASVTKNDTEQVLEVHNAGDFFGEIAALTGVPRTANVMADLPTQVLQVPAATLRTMMADPQMNRVFLTKMTERMTRLNLVDMPRFGGMDQRTLRELRSTEPPPEPETQANPA